MANTSFSSGMMAGAALSGAVNRREALAQQARVQKRTEVIDAVKATLAQSAELTKRASDQLFSGNITDPQEIDNIKATHGSGILAMFKSLDQLTEFGVLNELMTPAEAAMVKKQMNIASRPVDPRNAQDIAARGAGVEQAAKEEAITDENIREHQTIGIFDTYMPQGGGEAIQVRRGSPAPKGYVPVDRVMSPTQNIRKEEIFDPKVEAYKKAYGEQAKKNVLAANEAEIGLMQNDVGIKIMASGIFSGRFGPTQKELAKVLSSLGIVSGEGEKLIRNTEAYSNSRVSAVGRIIQQFGAGTGLSDADRKYATQGAAGLLTQNELSLKRTLYIDTIASLYLIKRYNDDLPKEYSGLQKEMPPLPDWVMREMGRKYQEGEELGSMEKWLVNRHLGVEQ